MFVTESNLMVLPNLIGPGHGHPVYNIRNMLQPSQKVRTLCSSYLDQLHVAGVRTSVNTRTFSVAAPRLLNEPTLKIRFAKTHISGRNGKHIFLVRLF